jgi:predicted lipoprotein
LSRTRLVVLRGSGKIVTIDKQGLGIAIEPGGGNPDFVLQTGLIFGNTVRDATGLLDAGDFLDSQQFNEISSELNRIAEVRVAAALKDPAVTSGRRVRFVGCAEIADETRVGIPLKIIPLQFSVEGP